MIASLLIYKINYLLSVHILKLENILTTIKVHKRLNFDFVCGNLNMHLKKLFKYCVVTFFN